MREIFKPTAGICAVLVFIFGCFIAARYWADAAQGQIPGSEVVLLVFLRSAIALEVLLPTTLYFSVITAISRLYRDSEITAMFACGISMSRIVKSVFLLSLMVAVAATCLSLYIRPWAWNQFYALKSRAKASFDLTRMRSGVFYELWNGERVIFAEHVNRKKSRAEHIFIQDVREDSMQIISAEKASQYTERSTGVPVLILFNGSDYEFSKSEDRELIMQFESLKLFLEPRDVLQEQRVKAAPTMGLLHSEKPEDMAELQWRLVTPVSTVLLALLGLLLSCSPTRRGNFAKLPAAVLIFAAYYYISAIAKKWVAQGVIGPVPGVWWGQIVLLLSIVSAELYRRPGLFREKA